MTPGVEGKGSREGGKWLAQVKEWRGLIVCGAFGRCGGNALEVPGRLAVGAMFDFADEINRVSTSTGGETAPQTAPKVYAESGLLSPPWRGQGPKS